MKLAYPRYLDQVYGGWIGKSIGGAVGARFEGSKEWLDLKPEEMFPAVIPPNDDLDMSVLWLKVLEEKGLGLEPEDLADAWIKQCWYPFNEFGIFRRNWKLRIPPPYSGQFNNQFWDTGMGCPMRAEIWGYVAPGAPDLAAGFAEKDGSLDHGPQSTGGEMMLAAMSAMAFFIPDVRRLINQSIHFLPVGTTVARLSIAALSAWDEGISLRDARDRIIALEGNPETSDARTNIPFILLALLYGGNDLEKTILAALSCGYDTDTTGASSGALIGQILGASNLSDRLKDRIGDELVMGIEYRREVMTLSALARDTTLVGIRLAGEGSTGIEFDNLPGDIHFAPTLPKPVTRIKVDYDGLPSAGPGETVGVTLRVEGRIPADGLLTIQAPPGWLVIPDEIAIDEGHRSTHLSMYALTTTVEWPMYNPFVATLSGDSLFESVIYPFGVMGTGLWRFLGVYFDTLPEKGVKVHPDKIFRQHFVSLKRAYLQEPDVDSETLYQTWSRILGKDALIPSYENEIDLTRLVGLEGSYCVYLTRTILCPSDRLAYLVIGNTDSYRLYLNGKLIAEVEESVAWSPFNNIHEVELTAGPNHILLKLLRRTDYMRFTLGFRERKENDQGQNTEDWMVDLADLVPINQK
jgi:ADP-ribosylglycohydrolase